MEPMRETSLAPQCGHEDDRGGRNPLQCEHGAREVMGIIPISFITTFWLFSWGGREELDRWLFAQQALDFGVHPAFVLC